MQYLSLFIVHLCMIASADGVPPPVYTVDRDYGQGQEENISTGLSDSYLSFRKERSIEQLRARQEQFDVLYRQSPQGIDKYRQLLRFLVEIKDYAAYQLDDQNKDTDTASLLIQEAILNAGEEEIAGQWSSSYESVYQWLVLYDSSNQSYISHTADLAEKIIISKTLHELKSGDNEEYMKQVTIDFADSLFYLLERNSIHLIDYHKLVDMVYHRCELLGEVLLYSSDDSVCVRENIDSWQRAIKIRHSELNLKRSWNRGEYLSTLRDLTSLNNQTLHMPESVMLFLAIKAGLQGLDMHTVLLSPWEWQVLERQLSNRYGGIGIRLSRDKEGIRIDEIYPETPASRSNLRIYDRILQINGRPTEPMDVDEAINEITGPIDTKVDMLVRDEDGREHTISLYRQTISIPNITGWYRTDKWNWNYMLDRDDQIGYVRIKCFNPGIHSEFIAVIDTLERDGMEGLIIDLRSNSGGDVESAIAIADYFIESGLLVRSQPRCGSPVYYMSHRDNIHPSYPIVILMNNHTASAAEILAGCLHDPKHNRAILVGERSFGKNTIQTISSIGRSDFKIKYSTAVYHFPTGQKLDARASWLDISGQMYGLQPDVEIRLLPHEIQGIKDIQRENLCYVWNYDTLSEQGEQNILKQYLQADSQLAAGLFVLKSCLVKGSHPAIAWQN